MVRARLTDFQVERGRRLGLVLRRARGTRTAVEIAAAAGVSVETVRKIEHGAVPTPAFFTVVALADACGLSIDDLVAATGAAAAPDRPVTGLEERRSA